MAYTNKDLERMKRSLGIGKAYKKKIIIKKPKVCDIYVGKDNLYFAMVDPSDLTDDEGNVIRKENVVASANIETLIKECYSYFNVKNKIPRFINEYPSSELILSEMYRPLSEDDWNEFTDCLETANEGTYHIRPLPL